MNRENASFLLGGIFMGFLVGFSIAYAIYRHEPAVAGFPGGMGAPADPSDPTGRGAASRAAGPLPGAGAVNPGAGMEQVREQLTALRRALEASPDDAQLLARLGNAYYDAGMYDQARDYYLRSLESDPSNPNVSTDLGICYRRLGQSEEALGRFRASIEIDSSHWQSWLNLGIVALFDQGDLDTAEEAFGKVKELNPGFEGMAQLEQALAHVRSGGKL